MKPSPLLMVLLCLCPWASFAQTASPADTPPRFGRLAPDQIQAIQGIGRSVLAARHGETADPVAEGLRADLKTLAAGLEDASQTNDPDVRIQGTRAGNSQNRHQAQRDALRGHLEAARQHRQQWRAAADQTATSDGQRAQHEHQFKKSDELQQEIDTALASGERANLAALRERLRPKSLGEVVAEQRAAARAAGQTVPEPEPTLSTLVRHR